jgi:sugar diacid utilization regulator
MEMSKHENDLSPLGRQLLGHAGVMKLFTQTEFDAALTEAKAEIMAIAIQTTRQAILIEREECAKLADECVNIEELGEAIRNRIPSQRQ